MTDRVINILSPFIRFADDVSKGKRNVRAYCPFHKQGNESTPSFYVYVGPQTHKKSPGSSFCHTCNEGWSLISLLRKLGVSYAGISEATEGMEEVRKEPHPINSLDFSMTVLPDAILGAYGFLPKKLIEEGFLEKTLIEFEIGFDRKHRRITFPLRDHRGNLVGVSGRTVVGEMPRYKIYRQEFFPITPTYEMKKGRVLWNLHSFFHRSLNLPFYSPVIITEGFKAAMWVAQCGYPETVALLGTHLSKEQKFLLSTITNHVVLFLDNDPAGKEGTKNIARNLGAEIEVRVANYPSSQRPTSPDDLSKEEVQQAIDSSLTTLQRKLRCLKSTGRISTPSTNNERQSKSF